MHLYQLHSKQNTCMCACVNFVVRMKSGVGGQNMRDACYDYI